MPLVRLSTPNAARRNSSTRPEGFRLVAARSHMRRYPPRYAIPVASPRRRRGGWQAQVRVGFWCLRDVRPGRLPAAHRWPPDRAARVQVQDVGLGYETRMRWNDPDTRVWSDAVVHEPLVNVEDFEAAQRIAAWKGRDRK